MNNFFKNNKRAVPSVALAVFLMLGLVIYYGGFKDVKHIIFKNERIIKETPTSRILESASVADGRFAIPTGESVSLVSDRRVVIDGGKTLKESYLIAEPEALAWAADAKLVYIRSLGTVTIEGVSSGWEVVFGSKVQKKGYVLSVIGGAISGVSEVSSKSSGYTIPNNWYDAMEAIKSIQALPQFKNATISGINFYYNEDGKRWGYAISSSNGTVSVPVR